MTESLWLCLIFGKSWWSLWIRGTAAISLGAVAIDWRRITPAELILLLLASSGLASLASGALLAVLPVTSPTATVRWIEAYALRFGMLLIVLGVSFHHLVRLPATVAS